MDSTDAPPKDRASLIVRPLVPFDDPWRVRAADASFEHAVAGGGEIVTLNHVRDMTAERNVSCVRGGGGGERPACSPSMVDGFQRYLSNLQFLIDQEGERTDLEFSWTSPLSGRAGRMFILPGLLKERGMATFLYAALLRQLAHQTIDDMLAASPAAAAAGAAPLEGDARAAAAAEAASLLRRAAGVWGWLAGDALPKLLLSLKGDRPGEVMPPASACMSAVALAEAQALAATRAAERGSAPALVAALWGGAAELWERGAKALRDASGEYVQFSDRLKRFVALGAALSAARAHKHHSDALHAALEAGAAERACVEAGALLAGCAGAGEVDGAWRALVAEEAADVETRRAAIEKDRLYVYCQAVPRDAPPLPKSKVLVGELAYEVPRVTAMAAKLGLNAA